jgi:hypothetical protein
VISCFEHETNPEFRKLVASDKLVVLAIGIEKVMEVVPNRYWGSQVIEGLLEDDRFQSSRLCESLRVNYPDEWLWAVGRANVKGLLPQAMKFLENTDNAGLINRLLLCVESLDERAAIAVVLKVAEFALIGEQASLALAETNFLAVS